MLELTLDQIECFTDNFEMFSKQGYLATNKLEIVLDSCN